MRATTTAATPASQPEQTLPRRHRLLLRRFVLAVALGVVALGLLVCWAWMENAIALRQPLGSGPPMVFNTALGFVLIGTALALLALGRRRTAALFALPCLVIAVLTLAEYALGIDLGIDQLLVGTAEWTFTVHPGRMGPNTATAFVCSALALLALRYESLVTAVMLATTATAIAVVPGIEYLIRTGIRYGWGEFTPMAPHTALGHTLLGVALIAQAWLQAREPRTVLPWRGIVVVVVLAMLTQLLWQRLDAELQRQWHDSLVRRATSRAEILATRAQLFVVGLVRLGYAYAREPAERSSVWQNDSDFVLDVLPPDSGLALLAADGSIEQQAGRAVPIPAALPSLDDSALVQTPIGRYAVRELVLSGRLWLRIVMAASDEARWSVVMHMPLAGFTSDELKYSERMGLELVIEPAGAGRPDDAVGSASVSAPAPLGNLRISLRDRHTMPGSPLAIMLLVSGLGCAILGGALIAQVDRQRAARLLAERLATELEHANAQLSALAATDPLTGIANRRQFEQLSRNTLLALRRKSEAVTLLMLDIDHFKRVNDAHGHAVGDIALRSMVGCIAPLLRPLDVLGRIGGEEFALLLPGTGTAAGLQVAQRLCDAVRRCEIPFAGGVLRITVSIGVASGPGDGDTLEELLARADRRLYAAKDAGRDRVVATD